MPRKYAKTKAKAKPKYYKKKIQRKKAIIPRSMVSIGQGFPKKLTMTHKFYLTGGLTSTSGNIGSYKISCNDMYRPDLTGGTTKQPMFFDQISVLYDHFTVIGSRCKFTVTPETTTTNTSRCAMFIDDNATTAQTSLDAIAEQQQGKGIKFFLAGNNNYQVYTSKWSARKFFGKSPLANTDLQGTPSASPIEQSFFTLCVQTDDTATIGFNFIAQVEYIAVWAELKEVSQS